MRTSALQFTRCAMSALATAAFLALASCSDSDCVDNSVNASASVNTGTSVGWLRRRSSLRSAVKMYLAHRYRPERAGGTHFYDYGVIHHHTSA